MELKYKAAPICRMSESELHLSANGLLFKIMIITGWKNYDDPTDRAVLNQQFILKLKESYPNVNTHEIEYAFRNTLIKDFGKNINLLLLDEVMQPYLSQRAEASRLEEQAVTKELPAPAVRVTDQEWIETGFETWKFTKNYLLLPANLYRILGLKPTIEEQELIKRTARGLIAKLLQDDKNYFSGMDYDKFYAKLLRRIAVGMHFEKKNN